MTSQSPRIYIYKITFEEVLYYYYGVHKEKKFGEYYMGSPYTHKWVWDFYTPKKQILELFDYTDEGYEECRIIEDRLIKPVLNDPWCLNERYGGNYSISVCKKNGKKSHELGLGVHGLTFEERSYNGKKAGKKSYELGLGVHSMTKQERIEHGKKTGKKAGQKTYELNKGIFAITPEEKIENSKKGGNKAKDLGLGIHALTTEQRIENGKKAGQKTYELNKGIHARTKEQMSEDGKKGSNIAKELKVGIYSFTKEQRQEICRKSLQTQKELGIGVYGLTFEQRSEIGKKINTQRWQCTETGYISTSAGLSNYQKKRGIDKSKRVRIE